VRCKAVKRENRVYPERKRRFAERIGYKCADLGGTCNATSSACSQFFDSFNSAQLACSVSKDCSAIGSSNGKFQILKKDDEDHCNNLNFEKVETNEVKIDVSEESFFQFTSIINHETFLTQIIQYDQDKTIYHVPKHGQLSEAHITIFHDLNLQATRLERFCVLERNFGETKKITQHSASMMDYKEVKSEGTLVRSDRKTSLKPVTVERIPKFVIDACGHLPIYQVEIDELKPDSLKNITMENYKMDETTDVENLFSISRSRREIKECPKHYCEDNFVNIQCGKTDCDSGWCYFQPINVSQLKTEQWKHITTLNYWCIPCCVTKATVPAMKVCSTMPSSHDICRTYENCKRCGDSDFDPNRSCTTQNQCPVEYCEGNWLSIQCSKLDCDRSDWRSSRPTHVFNASPGAWDRVASFNYWCLPCCIIDSKVPAMKVCRTIPTSHDICRIYENCKRCGDYDFDPNRSC